MWQGHVEIQAVPQVPRTILWDMALRSPDVPIAFETSGALWCNGSALGELGSAGTAMPPQIQAPAGIMKILLSPAAEALLVDTQLHGAALLPKRRGWNELLATGVDKASGMKKLSARAFPNSVPYLIALGDDVSDVPLFALADFSVGMADAVPEARAAADVVAANKSHSGGPGEVQTFLQLLLATARAAAHRR